MMKKIKQILIYSGLLLLLTGTSCVDTTEIPTGNRSFSCYINGELFVPKGSTRLSTSPINDGLSIYSNDNEFYVQARDYEKYTVLFNIVNPTINTFDLSESSGEFHDYNINHAILKTNGKTYLSKSNSGSVTFIEVSDTNVEGTFEFTLYNVNNPNDTIQVTNGKFND